MLDIVMNSGLALAALAVLVANAIYENRMFSQMLRYYVPLQGRKHGRGPKPPM